MSLSVLVVDDERKLTDMIAETLKQFPVFKSVLCSYDGQDAMRKLTNQKFDIVLLDLSMPKLDGLEVLNHLSDEANFSRTKIIIISGGFTPENISEAKNFTNHFLAKPFKIDDLKLKIGQVVKEIQKQVA
ncbi:response regulator [Bacteriovorax sp. Seq25_V]|uniref:response regulator n=1 Tax=Bacteriovorax sp. Seq25_V TaxID=1201288 RepID=UPI00038A1E9D|nr:response regulator [Bacteriovorax sp. Seq25_V]EQC44747.1 response regulator receiver domain protein [Bacteriovorax sp. Seq25_V]